MATPRDLDARRYYRVAYQRLEDGTLLLERLNRPKAAVYLAGYAVECILKALIVVTTPVGERAETLATFRGAAAHNLLWLRDRLAERRVHLPPPISRQLVFLTTWSTDLRYEPGQGDEDEAQRFIAATREVVRWADSRI